MFRPLALYISLRYTRAKKSNHFISFISLVSTLGISLGITVLITVLSVMNGFDHEIHNSIFNVARQVTISSSSAAAPAWSQVIKGVAEQPGVRATAPFVFGQGMLAHNEMTRGVVINGIDPELESRVSTIQTTMVAGSLPALLAGQFGIIIGQELAFALGLSLGDKIVLITPSATLTPLGVTPRFKRFTVVGIFHAGEGLGLDSTLVFINIYDAQKLFMLGDRITGLHLKLQDLYKAPAISAALRANLGANFTVTDWTQEFGSLFKAIRMEKSAMFIVLLFIIAVAAFNLVSSLVMTVNDKQADIAILRTLGASPQLIMSIFIIQGGIVGVFGTLFGVLGGVLLATHAPGLVQLLEQIFHTQFISAAIYYVDYLPSRLLWSDVWQVGLITLIMSLLATIYPAWRAANTEPVEALRYE